MADADAPGFLTGETEPERRVIRVDQAIDCCRESVNVVYRAFRDLAQIVNSATRTDPEDDSGFVFVPPAVAIPGVTGPAVAPRIIRLPGPTLIAAGGAVYLIGLSYAVGEALGEAGKGEIAGMILNTLAAVQRLNIRPRTAQALKESPCGACMMNRALPQKPQTRTVRKVSSRR